jgi:hypothetical protein
VSTYKVIVEGGIGSKKGQGCFNHLEVVTTLAFLVFSVAIEMGCNDVYLHVLFYNAQTSNSGANVLMMSARGGVEKAIKVNRGNP